MKYKIQLITIFLFMSFLNNLFGQSAPKEDPYWAFDQNCHFKPQINKGDYFKLKSFDFGWLILAPISEFIQKKGSEKEYGKCLSYGQKALYYWWYVDAQVTNGGFVQFYFNGYAEYVPTIIKGLEYVGDTEMADLVKRADKIYQKHKKKIEKAREKDTFDDNLYDKLEDLSYLDDDYYEMNEQTMNIIEDFIRNHSEEICFDESGNDFDKNYSGTCQTFFPNKKIKENFTLLNGTIDGSFKSYFENGGLESEIIYKNGTLTGERKDYFENAQLKLESTFVEKEERLKLEWFYENGKPQKLEHLLVENGEKNGEYKEWYSNGQLKESGTYTSDYDRVGSWLEYYEDGAKKLEAEFKNGDFLIHNHWNEKGEQILKEGTGLYINEYSIFQDDLQRNEQQYQNYQRHGTQKTFRNGHLELYQEMKNGVEEGYTRTYFPNGKIQEEKLYKDGRVVASKEFDMFDDPMVVTKIICEIEDSWLSNRDLELADSYPVPLNTESLAKDFQVKLDLFEGYPQDYELGFNYFVSIDETGKVIDLEFLVADNGFLIEKVEENIRRINFKPALKDGKPVKSYLVIKHQFTLAEKP